jgi:protein-tyrosine phosphatase
MGEFILNINKNLLKTVKCLAIIAALQACLIAKNNKLVSQKNSQNRLARLARNRFCFHTACLWSNIKYGSDFTFNQIAGDPVIQEPNNKDNIVIEYHPSGAIIAINDGKKTPLMLGSIPRKARHFDLLRNSIQNNPENKKSILLVTLNEPWECETSGLSKIAQKKADFVRLAYPTVDMTAPSCIDLIRAVRDLESRDDFSYKVALVHCKAGRGRSATVMAAYLTHIIYKANQTATVDQIEGYIKTCRPQIRLTKAQKEAVTLFYNELKAAQTLKNLCEKYKEEIKQRDLEVSC